MDHKILFLWIIFSSVASFHRILCVSKFTGLEPSIAILVVMYCCCDQREMKHTEKQELLACTDYHSTIHSVALTNISHAIYCISLMASRMPNCDGFRNAIPQIVDV